MPFVIAHRGASGTAPENTLAAVQKTADMGCQWVEVDGTATADAQAVLHHDNKIERCSDGTGLLLAKSLSELQSHDFGSWFDEGFLGERIPTLAQCATLCQQLKLGCNLEFKIVTGWEEPTAEVLCETVRECWPDDTPLLLSSFSSAALMTAKRLLPDVPRAFLATVIPRNWEEKLNVTGSGALHCGNTELLTSDAIEALTSKGYPVRVFTVDDPARAAELQSWGVQSIFTNHPERMMALEPV